MDDFLQQEAWIQGVLDQHFFFHGLIEKYSSAWREDGYSLERIIDACKEQISISQKALLAFRQSPRFCNFPTPGHSGFASLVEILTDQEKFKEAADLAARAKEEGWAGYWDSQIKSLEEMASDTGIPKIKQIIRDRPGILQTEIYNLVSLPKDDISTFLYWREKKGVVKRIKKGRTYQVWYKE